MKTQMSGREFETLCAILEANTGIELSACKKDVVFSRLIGRLRYLELTSFSQYIEVIANNDSELAKLIDKLTTHETYFFRELEQFEFLRRYCSSIESDSSVIKAWSAACASGEEAYSLAMVLDDALGGERWWVHGSDVSCHSIALAREAKYGLANAERIPSPLKSRYCLKGLGEAQGTVKLRPLITSRVDFSVANLAKQFHFDERFDIIFLRNILIYFHLSKQQQILNRVIAQLNPSGLLFLGHADQLSHAGSELCRLAPCVYRKAVTR